MTLADLESLRELGSRERTRLDYKAFCPTPPEIDATKITEDYCALANAGGGRIVFGAVDDGADGIKKFVGISEPRHQ